MNGNNFAAILLLSAITSLMTHSVRADEATDDIADDFAEPRRCISLSRLKRADIIDDRNILFYMRSGEIYLNQLPNRCSSLRMSDSFSYSPMTNRLCSIDLITPLRIGGVGGGISCALGDFRLVTEEEVLALKAEEPPESDLQGEGAEIESIDEDSGSEEPEEELND